MPKDTFEILDTPQSTLWAERRDDTILFHRTEKSSNLDTVVLEVGRETVRNVLVWADEGKSVTASLTGPMAELVKRHARELGLTEELFVWHAVKVFIEVGTS